MTNFDVAKLLILQRRLESCRMWREQQFIVHEQPSSQVAFNMLEIIFFSGVNFLEEESKNLVYYCNI